MLSPEALEEAGEALARVYRGIEADMLNYLVDLMLSGAGVTSKSVTAAALLGQTHADELRRIIERHAGEVDAELRATVEKFMRASDADDMERLGRPGTERAWPRQMDATVRGLAAILQRDNLHMEQGALDAFLSASTEAIARVNSGASTAERALHRAVRRLERDGVSVVQYRDAAGNLTVRNRVDVAVRRHVRTQIAQDGARMTARAMDEYGVQLVEVSSHPNARPSHAAWQGQVYGWRGAVSIDGRSYEGLEAATGYGSVDGLLGANCRHSFGPYLPGAPRAYERDPKHASGLPGEEVYKLEQRQRAGERAIREAKRELAGARKCYDVSPTNAARVEVVRAQDLLARRQDAMRRLVKESNARSLTGHPVLHRHPAREWAGDMPGGAWVKSSGRRQFLKIAGEHDREADLAAVNPGFASRDPKWTLNCQRCVPSYEMRRRGFDVVAKPRIVDESGSPKDTDPMNAQWSKVFDGQEWKRCGGKSGCDKLLKSWGDGARAEVYVIWPKKRGGGAHVFAAENIGGEIRYMDPQSGRTDVSGYFKLAKPGGTMASRIDGLDPSDTIELCCTSRKG